MKSIFSNLYIRILGVCLILGIIYFAQLDLSKLKTDPQNTTINFHYLGHSSFLIFFNDELSVLTDYGKTNAWLDYGWDSPIYDVGDLQPTVITYSHSHQDHYDTIRINTKLSYVHQGSNHKQIKGLSISTIPTSEDSSSINQNHSYLFKYQNLKILHLGDCQYNIELVDSPNNLNFLKEKLPKDIDVLLMPIEGHTQFIQNAEKFINFLKPGIVIPMHYWSLEYKKEFLNYLDSINIGRVKKYNIIYSGISAFTCSKKASSDSIIIIDISPSAYRTNN